MAKLSTCKDCGKQLKSEEKHIHSSKTYCDKCYEKVIRDSEEYKQLIKYICDNYEIDRPTGLMLKQIKDFKTEFGYTYGGIAYTLWYIKEILNKEFIVIYGISLVKFCYEDAKNYYIHQEEIAKSMEINSKAEIKTRVVKINNVDKNTKNNSLIDISNLLKGGDTY
jgi:predicted RNA-binding Zn-ribbon protein involved in translation (DUF1610 family)